MEEEAKENNKIAVEESLWNGKNGRGGKRKEGVQENGR